MHVASKRGQSSCAAGTFHAAKCDPVKCSVDVLLNGAKTNDGFSSEQSYLGIQSLTSYSLDDRSGEGTFLLHYPPSRVVKFNESVRISCRHGVTVPEPIQITCNRSYTDTNPKPNTFHLTADQQYDLGQRLLNLQCLIQCPIESIVLPSSSNQRAKFTSDWNFVTPASLALRSLLNKDEELYVACDGRRGFFGDVENFVRMTCVKLMNVTVNYP